MAASPLLIFHVGMGTIGLFSGAAALSFRKGSARHITAGKVFLISMLGNALSATLLAYLIQDWDNILGGPTTIYFIATAWMTLRRKEGETGRFEILAFLVAVAGVAVNLVGAWLVTNSESGAEYTLPVGIPFIFAALWAVAATGDLRLILRRGISGTQRIARHLWRMCYGMFVATGSLFLGQQQVFPKYVQDSIILFVLAFAPLALMVFWLFRVLFTKWYKRGNSLLSTP